MNKFVCSHCSAKYEEYHMTCPNCKYGYSFKPVPIQEELDKVVPSGINGTIEKERVIRMIDYVIHHDAHTDYEKRILMLLKARLYRI